jgi:hypothetical protein
MYYFGYITLGHDIYNENLRSAYAVDREIRPEKLDGVFCVKDPHIREPEGLCTLTKVGEYTVIAFWDRSGDDRFGSNSAFIEKGDFTFEEMVERAERAFPSIFVRFHFKLKPVKRIQL